MAVVLAAVALFAVAMYLPATRFNFVWDDASLITGHGARDQGPGFWTPTSDSRLPSPAYYRPLVTLSFRLDRMLSRTNAHWFHFVNVLLFALAAAAVTLVLWELLHSGVWALLGGLLFTAHSSHVETVAYVSGRTDIMLTLLTALAAFVLLRSFRKRNRWWRLAVPPMFGLALLSKETAVMFPLLVALTPLLVGVRYDRRYWWLVLASLAVLAGYLLLHVAAVRSPIPLAIQAGFGRRLLAAANTFGLYIRMFFWPLAHRVRYPASNVFFTLTPNLLLALLFAVSVPLLSLQRRFTATLWGYAWTIAFLLPVLSIATPGPLAAERLLCLPSAGMVMVLVTVLSRLLTFRITARKVVGIGLAAIVLFLAVDTMVRSRIWRNDETLFTAMVREAPDAPTAYAGLADAIAAQRPDSALALYNHALRLDQGYVHAYVNSARLLSERGDHRRAIHQFRLARDLDPNSAMVLNDLGVAFTEAGEPDSALATFAYAVAKYPNSHTLRLNYANSLSAAGRTEEANAELRSAAALDSAAQNRR